MGNRSLRNYRRAERERCLLAPCDLSAVLARADAMLAADLAAIPDDAWTEPRGEDGGATADMMVGMGKNGPRSQDAPER